jgi:hypothetical protein
MCTRRLLMSRYLMRLCFTLCGTRALARLGMPIDPHPIL